MFMELQYVLQQTHDACERGDLSPSIERELMTFREHLCESRVFCIECMQAHKKAQPIADTRISSAELAALFAERP